MVWILPAVVLAEVRFGWRLGGSPRTAIVRTFGAGAELPWLAPGLAAPPAGGVPVGAAHAAMASIARMAHDSSRTCFLSITDSPSAMTGIPDGLRVVPREARPKGTQGALGCQFIPALAVPHFELGGVEPPVGEAVADLPRAVPGRPAPEVETEPVDQAAEQPG